MRVIEKNMNTAIRNGKDFRSGNTSVTHSINADGNSEAIIKLHGNHIGTVTNAVSYTHLTLPTTSSV